MATDIKTVWEFVEKYYPNYTSSDEIAKNNDLQKIIDEGVDEDTEPTYNKIKEEVNSLYHGALTEDALYNEVLKEIENQKNVSDASIFEQAIESYIETLKVPQIKEKTYYLFGEDVVKTLNDESFDSVLELIKTNESYGTFIFTEGETKSHELAEAMIGWLDYAIITEEEYNKL